MGVKPRCYFSPGSCGISVPGETQLLWQPLFVSLFLHGGLLHLGFNMLFLWVFGPGLEERLGKWKFLMFYFGCGLVASLAHIITHPFSDAPAIGASGAISGVLGAYLILLPRSWILTYFPPIFLFPCAGASLSRVVDCVAGAQFLHTSAVDWNRREQHRMDGAHRWLSVRRAVGLDDQTVVEKESRRREIIAVKPYQWTQRCKTNAVFERRQRCPVRRCS
jgi:hypothetical protein